MILHIPSWNWSHIVVYLTANVDQAVTKQNTTLAISHKQTPPSQSWFGVDLNVCTIFDWLIVTLFQLVQPIVMSLWAIGFQYN